MKPTLEDMLRAWGHFYGEGKPKEWDEAADDPSAMTISHPIARAMDFAGGDESPSGRSARAMKRIRKSPTWGFDPVVCTETRSFRIATNDDIPQIVQRVQRAALELYRIDTMRGTVLRFEYCKRGRQIEKAAMMATVGLSCGVRQYRESLQFAKGWMDARLSRE
jgi:hypothetical protein